MKTEDDYAEEHAFEEEVRRIAKAMWPLYLQSGAMNLSGLECDGYYETEDCIHLLECTCSRLMYKAEKDVAKLDGAADKLRAERRDKGVKTWFITKFDPTNDQMGIVRKSTSVVTGISYSTFQAKLMDVGTYLECRLKHRFGSIDHPVQGQDANEIKYIDIPILGSETSEEWSVAKIANSLLSGERFTLIGDYGIGKSMTLREVFKFLRQRYLHKHTTSFPIYINLRDHHGSKYPAEIFERHARDIGYPDPSHLVRAWKSGYATIILDGFDEIASTGMQIEWRKLREARSLALTGVRKLIADSPIGCGIAIAGRKSFFDSENERNLALGDRKFRLLLLHEFTEDQVSAFFKSVNFSGNIPSWLPARPLLLSTIFWIYSQEQAKRPGAIPVKLPDDPSLGWEILLDAISEREAKIEAQVTGPTIRRILEILATKARATTSGLGPLTTMEITGGFQAITGTPPSPQALSVLQRLPGLGVEQQSDDGQRTFLDEDLVDALSSADVYRIIVDPYSASGKEDILAVTKSLSAVGSGIVTQMLNNAKFDHKRTIQTLMEFDRRKWLTGAAADLFIFAQQAGIADLLKSKFKDLDFEEIAFSENDLSKVIFDTCIIRRLTIPLQHDRKLWPVFNDCLIELFHGMLSESDLPKENFINCNIEHYIDDAATNAAILRSEMPVKFRVLLTILRKLFVQSLGGRQASALKRGLDGKEQSVVDEVLETLFREAFATHYKAANGLVIIPIRRMKRRVMTILSSPLSSKDELVLKLRNI